jgi:outer membrane protein assembly factor BamD
MRRALAVALGAVLPVLACSHGGGTKSVGTLTSNSDNVVWEAGQKLYKQKHWEEARQHFKRIVEGFPQSDHAADARIALGDTYFDEGGEANYILAVSEYRGFLTLYPSHPRSEYAQFRVAVSFDRQRHGPDRDSTNTEKALEEYQRLLEIYPTTKYQEEARTRIVDCRQNLARTEFLVGYFYQRTRRAYRASLARYELLLKEYPDYARLDEVLFRTAECLRNLGRFNEALPRVNQILEDYPKSPLLDSARKLREEILTTVGPALAPPPAASGGAPAPPPNPAASPGTPSPAPPPQP